VRQRHAGDPAGAAAFRQVRFNEVAVAAGDFRERVQRFDHARAFGPAAAGAARQRDHGGHPVGQRLHAGIAIPCGQTGGGIHDVMRRQVFDAAGGGETVLRQTDAAATQIGLDLLVLRGVEPVALEQRFETLGGIGGGVRGAREHVIEQVLHHAG
jgi:hypothetical protein